MKRFARDERGAAALEYAFILPALLTLAIGVMDIGRLVWTEVTLDRAVQAAARCAAVNTSKCGVDAAIQSYAVSASWGLTVPASVFTVSRPSCGVTVRAQTSFRYTVPWPMGPATIKSSACYPTG